MVKEIEERSRNREVVGVGSSSLLTRECLIANAKTENRGAVHGHRRKIK